jgi:predicted nucleic acid-binding protein
VVASLPRHAAAREWVERGVAGEFEWVVASHTLIELFAVLTRLPIVPRIGPPEAMRLIDANVLAHARIAVLSRPDYRAVLESMVALGLSGGVIYDALITRAARRARVERIVTANASDFRRLCPDGAAAIVELA